MDGRALVLVALVALVAGCPVADTSDAPETPESRPLPQGFATDGVDAEVAMASHREGAVESGSVTLTRRSRFFARSDLRPSSDLDVASRIEWHIDFEAATYWRRSNASSVQEAYVPPDEDRVYTYHPAREGSKVSPYGGNQYVPPLAEMTNPRLGHVTLAAYLEHLNYTLTERGERTVRFESSGFEAPESNERFGGAVRFREFENVSATLVVDYDGRIHRFTFGADRYRGVVEPRYLRSYEETVAFTDHGATPVPEPGWVAEARD